MPSRRIASERPEESPRATRRKGAGPPAGNFNALKTGDRSVRVATVRALLSTPTVQRIIQQLRHAQRRREPVYQSILDEIAETERRTQTIRKRASSADSEEAEKHDLLPEQ